MLKRLILLFMFFLVAGCGSSEKNTKQNADTSVVSQKDLDHARDMMHINKDLQIEPKGYAFEKFPMGITGTFFKFIAKTNKIEKVFASDIDTSKFMPNALLTDYRKNVWWDINGKELIGGNVKMPGDETMSVGYIDNKDGTLTVYIEM